MKSSPYHCVKNGMKRRRFIDGTVHHIYQKPADGIVIFYTELDFIVFLTLFSVVSRKYDVTVLGVCPMIDHWHIVVTAGNKTALSAFVQEYTSRFVKEYNFSLGREKGRMFTRRFGCAPKRSDKDVRSTLAYLYNNAPERKLCSKAEEYKWNLLAYGTSCHPYSAPLDHSHLSSRMKKALSLVKSMHTSANYLGYIFLERLYRGLTSVECEQITDYILSLYSPVDYGQLEEYYGEWETMLQAFSSNTGSEYELREDWAGYTDKVYSRMTAILLRKLNISSIKEVLTYSLAKRKELYRYLLSVEAFNPRQVAKFLQIAASEGVESQRFNR